MGAAHTMPLEWNQLYKLGTDVAGFMFFDPKPLAHRKADANDWWSKDFTREFTAGTLVAFCTGSDGVFTLKFVRRPLTPRETSALVVKESFRYEVSNGRLFRNGRLYWDNSDHLPSEEQLDEADEDPEGWLEIPNGRYRITVHALDWFTLPESEREAEGDISHYIVQFQEVRSLKEIPVPTELPWLIASKSWHEKRQAELQKNPAQS